MEVRVESRDRLLATDELGPTSDADKSDSAALHRGFAGVNESENKKACASTGEPVKRRPNESTAISW
jgi:hypothetical protein